MKFIFTIVFCLLTLNISASKSVSYKSFFREDIEEADHFLIKSAALFAQTGKKYNHSKVLLRAIIYPELLRYNYFNDFFETTSLEFVYVNYGSKAADFSIGHFQMKPSFAESIERHIKSSQTLKKKYKSLMISKNFTLKYKRRLRVERLKNTAWQLVYLNAFIDVCLNKFPELKRVSIEKKLFFLAAIYNIGINNTLVNIKRKSTLKTFPFGPKYGGNQFCYAEIAREYLKSNQAYD